MNKIQRTFLFALLICMILLTGCVSDNEQIKAPETLKITAELPENYPKALSKYKVDWYVQDDETAIQNLLHGEIISAEEHKMGVVVKKSRHEKYLFLICFFKSRHEEYFCRSCFFKSGHGQ